MSVEEVGGLPVERFLLALALALVVSKLFGEMAERMEQPAVLGGLLAGVMLRASVLAIVPSVPGQAGYNTLFIGPPLLKITFAAGEAALEAGAKS